MSQESCVKRHLPFGTGRLVAGLQIVAFLLVASTSMLAQDSSSISGEVLVKGQPAPNVKVSLLSMKPGQPSIVVARTRTDSEGKFLFKGVGQGRYLVRPFLPGYTMENVMGQGMTTPVGVGEGDSVEGINFRMIKGGVITGKVTDSESRPVVRERIEVQRVGPNREPMFVELGQAPRETDDRGIYRIYGLPSGNYVVSAGIENAWNRAGPRKSYSRTYYQGKTTSKDADIVKVTEGNETTEIDLKFAEELASYTVSGKIIGSSGEPVPGMRIQFARKLERTTYSTGPEVSGPDGAFSISGILPGKYTISTSFSEGAEEYSDPVELDVSSADVSGIELRMRKGGSISGNLVIEGTSDPKVIGALMKAGIFGFPEVPSGGQSVRVYANTSGYFRLSGIRPGTVRLEVIQQNQPNVGYLKQRVERDGVVVGDQRRPGAPFEIRAGEQISGVRIVVSTGTGVIRGKLVVVNGEMPPTGVRVSLQAFEPLLGQTFPTVPSYTSKSTFLFENLPGGQYQVTAMVWPDQTQPQRQAPVIFRSSVITLGNDKTEHVTVELDLSSKPR